MDNLELNIYEKTGEEKNTKLVVEILNTSFKQRASSFLLGEMGEALVSTSGKNIVFDFTAADYINSTGLGSIMNIQKAAIQKSKKISFRFNSELEKLINVTSFNKIADVEFVEK